MLKPRKMNFDMKLHEYDENGNNMKWSGRPVPRKNLKQSMYI